MADPRGFLKVRERRDAPERRVGERVHDWREVHVPSDPAVVREQAGRCMDCGIPFCHAECPLGNLIPEWNTLAWSGNWRAAIERLHATNNFPEFTGGLCPAPCEEACVLSINQPAVTIKNVEKTIIDTAWRKGWVTPQIPARLTGKTVAVVGSGPAGLAAAQQLTRAGHTVAVFERDDQIGGLLRYGIPDFKMEKSVLDRRLGQMRAEGTRFHAGVDIGRDLTGQDLLERFDAVLLATGSRVPRDLADTPGRGLRGICMAVDYLTRNQRHLEGRDGDDPSAWIDASGRDVVIVGGGDTGSDCLGTALRQGARSVTCLDINPMPPEHRAAADPWPTYPKVFRVSTSQAEGGTRTFSTSTIEFVGEAGHVSGVRVVEVRGKRGHYAPVEGSERILPAGLVIMALGFAGAERRGVVEQLGLEVDDRGRIARDAQWQTSHPGVFVAGDAGRGQSLLVWAIAEGRSAAAAVDRYFRGRTELPAPLAPTDQRYRP